MKVNAGDYVIAVLGSDRKRLAKVKSSKGNSVVLVEDGATEEVSVGIETIVGCFGPSPEPGSAYSVKMEPLVKEKRLKPWGTVRWYRKTLKAEDKNIAKSLKLAAKKMDRFGLLKEFPIDVEIRPPRGQFEGSYKALKDTPDILTLKVQDLLDPLGYLLYHELGHHMWCHYLSNGQKASWIRMYHKAVAVATVTSTVLKNLCGLFTDSGQTIQEFRKDLDDDDKDIFDSAIDHVSDTHFLSKKDIGILIADGWDISKVWPKSALDIGDIDVAITEYANKSPEEFWSEAVALRLTGGSLPKDIRLRVKRTLKDLG